MSAPATFAIAILAGGEGSRIGGGKPLLRLGSQTLIGRAFEQAQGWSSQVVVVVRSPDQLGTIALPSIVDDPGIAGPLAGLAAALGWAARQGAEALLTVPCDTPFLPDDLPQRLRASFTGQSVALASSGDRLHPLCGLWRPMAREQIPAYCAAGRRSLHGFAEHVGFAAVGWPVQPIDPFFNINSSADLAEAERMLAG